jgi:hypothetical protein
MAGQPLPLFLTRNGGRGAGLLFKGDIQYIEKIPISILWHDQEATGMTEKGCIRPSTKEKG